MQTSGISSKAINKTLLHNDKNQHNNFTTCNNSVHSKTDNKYRNKKTGDNGGQIVHEELRGMQIIADE